jgi:hypothetical protein
MIPIWGHQIKHVLEEDRALAMAANLMPRSPTVRHNVATPNDSAHGGCLVFEFAQPMDLINFGILDIDEKTGLANITVSKRVGQSPWSTPAFVAHFSHNFEYLFSFPYIPVDEICKQVTNSNGVEFPTFDSPRGIGNNGFWAANSTLALNALTDIETMVVCFPGSGALSFIHYAACNN